MQESCGSAALTAIAGLLSVDATPLPDPKPLQRVALSHGGPAKRTKPRPTFAHFDPSGHTAFDWYVPSPDGTLVALSLSTNGSEDGELRFLRTSAGTLLEPDALKSNVRSGCFLYFFVALGAVAVLVTVLYFVLRHE